ncbi:MAG: NUDIX hydrolase [Candidatus Moranbacteria bacterium]|nr:NUDIX hydrolase [Candidatus Moranbacteria bacterium]
MKSLLLALWRRLNFSKHFQLNIIRMFQDQFLVGVTGLIFNEKNEVLVFKHTYRQRSWSLPGGYMNGKEHPKEALAREIKEESGFTVSIDWRMKVRTDRETARLDISYIGTYIGGEFVPSKEVSEARFCSLQNLPPIRRDQLFLIENALEQREHFFSENSYSDPLSEQKHIAHF